MPLFQQSVLKRHLTTLPSETTRHAWQVFTAHFLDPVKQENIRNSKEEQYQKGFLRELFVSLSLPFSSKKYLLFYVKLQL